MPLAAANFISWVLLNVDNLVVVRISGEVALGYYVLALNISSSPMSRRSGRRSGPSRFQRSDATTPERTSAKRDPIRSLLSATALSWAAAVPARVDAGRPFSLVDPPVVRESMGSLAPVLVALGLFGRLAKGLCLTYGRPT